MPVMTTSRSTAPATVLDLEKMRGLYDAPNLAPLVKQRFELRQRLDAINKAVIESRRELYALRNEESYTALSQQRQITARITALEDEAVPIEQTLATLGPQIEEQENQVKAQLTVLLAQEGLPVVEAFVAALEVLTMTSTAYMDFAVRCQRLVGTPLVPQDFVFAHLPACVQRAQTALESLKRASGQ